MKIHLRFDGTNKQHTRMTVFINGQNTGQLCMSPDQADWFYLVVERGAHELSPPGMEPIVFLGSGQPHRPDEPIGPPPSS